MSEIRRKRVGFVLVGALSLAALTVAVVSCGVPSQDPINGPGVDGNNPPTLEITEPNADDNFGQGTSFLIRWTDSDSDSNASISFDLVNIEDSSVVPIVADLSENDQVGPDSFTVPTGLVPVADYYVRGTIDDQVNPPVEVFALVGDTNERVVIGIDQPGTDPGTAPPRVAVTEPQFDLSVTEGDTVSVVVAPPGGGVFDTDSEFQLWVLLDLDLNPSNDDPANPDPSQIIVLSETTVPANTATLPPFVITIDLGAVPPRPDGEPYFIRATADDALNPRVHGYAPGTLNVVRQVAGVVDLSLVGKLLSGARWYGFNPAGNLGSKMVGIPDFDADGIDDMVFVSQFGNPRNAGQVGEAYLIYGLNGARFGGTIAINSVAETVQGAIFEAPPMRFTLDEQTRGITDANFLPDMTADGRPELIFGLPQVVHAFDTVDFDPSDNEIDVEQDTVTMDIDLTQGRECMVIDNDDPIQFTYTGVVDTYINSAAGDTAFGGANELAWQNEEGGPRKFALIKFEDVLNTLPPGDLAFINIDTVQADLEFRIFNPGGNATVHQALTDFDESTTYNTYAVGGEDPVGGELGEPNIDYLLEAGGGNGALGTIDGGAPDIAIVSVDQVMQRLIDGLLVGSNNEMRFIIVPDDDEGANETQVRSSDYSDVDVCPFIVDRPVLRIQYQRRSFGPAGCFPDDLVNNRGDSNEQDQFDVQFFSGGMAVIVNSTNRDNQGVDGIDVNRLASTSVSLELTGQEGPPPGWVLDNGGVNDNGNIFVRADNSNTENVGNDPPDEAARISGSRIIAGGYEWEFSGPSRLDLFGQSVGWMGDVTNDGLEEIVISAPRNERFFADVPNMANGFTTWASTLFTGSIVVLPGQNYNSLPNRDTGGDDGTSTIPILDHGHLHAPGGSCTNPVEPRHLDTPTDHFEVYAEDIDDMLGGAGTAGDFNQDGLDDLLAGAFLNNRGTLQQTGAAYILYSRSVLSDFLLENADDPFQRAPMIRIRGVKPGDQIGWKQLSGQDVNGDRIDDVFIASPRTDFGGVTRSRCGGDFDDDGNIDQDDFEFSSFELCLQQFGSDLFLLDDCKVFDYDNDADIDEDDRCIFCCLSNDCSPATSCIFGKTAGQCCVNVEDNGFVGVAFGGRFLDGDRDITQLATSDLPGAVFYGGQAGHRAGADIASAGDFNQDGFGDLLISVPGETRLDSANRTRVGVVYLVFGGTHLENTTWNLSDPIRGVGSEDLPGIVFFSPYVAGRPNEAAPLTVAGLGDINNDGFEDIAIGNPRADFIDLTFPQGPDAPGSDAAAGRRRDAGDIYIVYGNNFGSNRGAP